jgi:hypothetical protein
VRGLKDDEIAETDHLKEQYEEQRREGIERIKSKYKNNK